MRYPEDESTTLEWKRELPQNDQIIKTIIGFCNQNGGKLIIGVANDGTVTGLSSQELQKALESLDKAISEASHPSILPRVYSQRFGEKSILIVEVSEGMSKPYYRKSEGIDKGTYIRLGRNTLRASPEIIQELQWQSIGIDFEAMSVHSAAREDLDDSKIEYFLNHRKNDAKARATDPILRAYHILALEHSKNYPTYAGLLLFGKTPQHFLSEAMIICSHFKGVSGRDAIASIDCEGDLFEQFQKAYSFIIKQLPKAFQIKKVIREETLEIPEIALREALLNAIIHRNYHIKAPIKIAIYDDRIEIFSPGSFPGPLDAKNLKAGITYLRNPILCKVFREAGYVEKLGTGLIAIFDSYQERGLTDPQILEGENYIKCILPRTLKKRTNLQSKDLLEELFSLTDEVSLADVQKILKVSRATATRRLRQWIKEGKVKRTGLTRSTRFRRA